jgi:hypothetical protein
MLERAQWDIGHRDESGSESSNSGQHEGSKGHSDSSSLSLSRSQREVELENDNASVNANGGQAYSQHANNVNIVFMIVNRHESGVSIELWKGVKVRNKSLSILVAELFQKTWKNTAKQLSVRYTLSNSHVSRQVTIGLEDEDRWKDTKEDINRHIKESVAASEMVTIAVYFELR